jgi:hypothetical protein
VLRLARKGSKPKVEEIDGATLTRAKMEDKWKRFAAKFKSTGTAWVKIESRRIVIFETLFGLRGIP